MKKVSVSLLALSAEPDASKRWRYLYIIEKPHGTHFIISKEVCNAQSIKLLYDSLLFPLKNLKEVNFSSGRWWNHGVLIETRSKNLLR